MKLKNKKNKGYVQVYTGDGKGKTTAALGVCLRASGAKKKIYIAQFMKLGIYNEINSIKLLKNFIEIEQFGTGNFVGNKISVKEIEKAKKGIEKLKKKSSSGKYDIIVLDEINVAIHYKIIPVSDLINIINNKEKYTELIITGRNANSKIIKMADLVTEMKEIKHYYKIGIKARIGIEK